MEELCLIYNTSKLKALFETLTTTKPSVTTTIFSPLRKVPVMKRSLGGHILVDSAGFQKQVLLQLLS